MGLHIIGYPPRFATGALQVGDDAFKLRRIGNRERSPTLSRSRPSEVSEWIERFTIVIPPLKNCPSGMRPAGSYDFIAIIVFA